MRTCSCTLQGTEACRYCGNRVATDFPFLAIPKINCTYPLGRKKVGAVSGYFDPLHVGHLDMIDEARKKCDELVVILNTDEQAETKKGGSVMNQWDRATIMRHIKGVDGVFLSIDEDGSICKSLEALKPDVFFNGGDRSRKNVPEVAVCRKHKIKMIFGCGEKIRSSSDLVRKAMEWLT